MSIQYSDPVELEARVVKLERLLATLMQNGLNELSNARSMRFGEAGAMRLGPEGIVFMTLPSEGIGITTMASGAPGTGAFPAVYWTRDFPSRNAPPTSVSRGYLYGYVDANGANVIIGVDANGGFPAQIAFHSDSVRGYSQLDGIIILDQLTDDPVDGLGFSVQAGGLYYNTTINTVRAYVNGAWISLANAAALTTHEAAADPHTGYVLESLIDAKGDLITATADNTPARQAVGTNAQVLTADSTTSTGLKWATPAGGGMKKVSGAGYVPLPAGPGAGPTVTKSATANTYGAYAELRAAAGSGAIYIFGVLLENISAIGNNYAQIAIATGAAGAEVDVAVVKTNNPSSVNGEFIPLATPVAVAATTRIAARWAGSRAVADTTPISLLTCAQSDLVDL